MKKNRIGFILFGLLFFVSRSYGQENTTTGTIFIHSKPDKVTIQIPKLDYKLRKKSSNEIIINDVPEGKYTFKFSFQGIKLSEKFFLNAEDTLTVLADFHNMEVTGVTADELRILVKEYKRQKYIQSIYSAYLQNNKKSGEKMESFLDPINLLRDSLINYLYPSEEVFCYVKDMPLFNGVDPTVEFRKYIAYNLRYPDIAAENGIMGRVVVMFAVNSEGQVVDPVILNSVDTTLDNEAIRVVTSSPFWTPGRQIGNPVKVLFIYPINFVLQ